MKKLENDLELKIMKKKIINNLIFFITNMSKLQNN